MVRRCSASRISISRNLRQCTPCREGTDGCTAWCTDRARQGKERGLDLLTNVADNIAGRTSARATRRRCGEELHPALPRRVQYHIDHKRCLVTAPVSTAPSVRSGGRLINAKLTSTAGKPRSERRDRDDAATASASTSRTSATTRALDRRQLRMCLCRSRSAQAPARLRHAVAKA